MLLLTVVGTVRTGLATQPRVSYTGPEQLERAFQGVVRDVAPSVVGIRAQRRYLMRLSGAPDDDGGNLQEQLVAINGSGTIIHADGLILTNEHVVQAAHEIEVFFSDGRRQQAEVFSADARSDLAILRVPQRGLTPAKFCDWNDVARGQWALAIGNPYGLGNDGRLSVSVGVISNLDRRLPGLGEVDDRLYADMIQTTAAIHPGNSGGPLFNMNGEMIGVVTAMHTRAAADEGVGFAIPLTPARRTLIDLLRRGQEIQYGYLGLTVRAPTPGEHAGNGAAGVVVDKVDPTGPAAQSGIRLDDVITALNGTPIEDPAHLVRLVGTTTAGTRVTVEVRRTGQHLRFEPTVRERVVSRVSWMRGEALLWRGMRLANVSGLTPRQAGATPQRTGVVVIDVVRGSGGERAGMRIGDVIQRVEERAVPDVDAFRASVRDKSGPIVLELRERGRRTVHP